MLPFKPSPLEHKDAARWNIGVDRQHVAIYVAAALVVGFALGFMFARNSGRKETPPVVPTATAATAATAAPEPTTRPAASETAPTEYRKVTRLLRADTLDVQGIGPVRMIGIETPDGKTPKEIYSRFGQSALNFIEKAALNQDVRLEFDPANTAHNNKDESGQTLAYVYTRDGTLLNSELLREGLAFVRSLEEFKMSSDFRSMEREAMQSLRGVWGSGSGSTASSAAPSASAAERPGRVAPLAPSAIGPNIPAISGASSSVATNEATVLVSPADRLYHKAGCELLDGKKQSLGLSQARSQGYHPCSRCFPSTSMRAP